jgi:hypothetical protein
MILNEFGIPFSLSNLQVVLSSVVLGLCIEVWKLTKGFDVKVCLVFSFQFTHFSYSPSGMDGFLLLMTNKATPIRQRNTIYMP